MPVLVMVFFCMPLLFSQPADSLQDHTHRTSSGDTWIAGDKAQHFLCSFLMTGTSTYYLNRYHDCPSQESQYKGMAIAFSLGISKEIWDFKSEKGNFSFKDLTADALGVLTAALLVGWW